MAEVLPFKMVHYNPDRSEDLSCLITPPYDIISPEQQEFFYNTCPHNIIRLVLGKQFASDTADNNRYTRAASTLRKWMRDNVLVRRPKPGFTLYQMDFREPEGEWRRLDGLVGLVKVGDYGVGKVLPHEKTYLGPKKDQLELLRACRANFTPIHAMFDDHDEVVMQSYQSLLRTKPEQEVQDSDNIVHRTWNLSDEKTVKEITEFLGDKSLFIADGHHRYETSLAYCNEMENLNLPGPEHPHEYVMAYLTSMSHPGLTILPAHRMLRNIDSSFMGEFSTRLRDHFDIHEMDCDLNDLEKSSHELALKLHQYLDVGGHFGMVVHGDNKFFLLSMKNDSSGQPLIAHDLPEALAHLDVTILREFILGHVFGLDKENSEDHIEYTPSIFDAVNRTLRGDVQISFILNPTRVDQMRKAAELGQKMPHKSTYFYPKISSGLVLNVF